MLLYENLIFVLSDLRVSNSGTPLLSLNYSLKSTTDFFMILRRLDLGNNKSYRYYDGNLIGKTFS